MNSRSVLVVLASGALALGLSAPAVQAAPAEKPSGSAMVRIDGGTAYAKQKAKGEYRIVLPQGISIDWMGQVTGKGMRTGTFTPKALVAGWAKLGHSEKTGALTTLTWSSTGKGTPSYVISYLSKPRMNTEGQVTFIAKTQNRRALPSKLLNFSINVTMASGASARSFSLYGPNIMLDSNPSTLTWMYPTITDVSTAIVNWVYLDSSHTCRQGLAVVGNAKASITAAFACGSLTINATTTDGVGSYAQITVPGSSQTAQGSLFVSYSVTPKGSGAKPFDIQQGAATWQRNGGVVSPSCQTYPCS